jgi:hypothetical protein
MSRVFASFRAEKIVHQSLAAHLNLLEIRFIEERAPISMRTLGISLIFCLAGVSRLRIEA